MNSSPSNSKILKSPEPKVSDASERRIRIANLVLGALLATTVPVGMHSFCTLPQKDQTREDKQNAIRRTAAEAEQADQATLERLFLEHPGLKRTKDIPKNDAQTLANQAGPDTLSE